MYSSSIIPSRTQSGDACLAVGDVRVSGRQRQFLRLIDGARNLEQIGAMMPGRDLPAELAELMDLDLVAPIAKGVSVRIESNHVLLPERWQEAMVFMKARVRDCLGVMGQPINHLLERVKDLDAARNAVARWHLALRESRSGRDVADTDLTTVTEMLGIRS